MQSYFSFYDDSRKPVTTWLLRQPTSQETSLDTLVDQHLRLENRTGLLVLVVAP